MIRAEGENRTLVLRTTTAHSAIELQPPLFNSVEFGIKTLPETQTSETKTEAQLEKSSETIMPTTSAFCCVHLFPMK